MLRIEFGSQFSRDYKKCIAKHWPIDKLDEVIELIAQNDEASLTELTRHHDMHTLKGKWKGRQECHVANIGNWLVIWSADDKSAFLERTGTHDELFK